MHRRLSLLSRNSASGSASTLRIEEKVREDDESEVSTSTVTKDEPLPVPSLKVKRVDYYYSRWSKGWKYRNTNANITVERLPVMSSATNDQWRDFSFVIVRTVPQRENQEPSFKLVVKSEYILKACKDVIQSWPGISWNSDPLELDPELFITFHDRFLTYANDLRAKKRRSEQDTHLMNSVDLLNKTVASDFKNTLATLNRLTSHGEITFDLLYAILVPRSIFVAKCKVTGLPRLFMLTSWIRTSIEGKGGYQLSFESVDLVDRHSTHSVGVGRVQTNVFIRIFRGTISITSLDAYPLIFHPDAAQLTKAITERGKKWVSLIGVHHKQYDGIAAVKAGLGDGKVIKHNVHSRIMVDRATFRRLNPNYLLPLPLPPKVEDSNGEVDSRFTQPLCDQYGNLLPPPIPNYGSLVPPSIPNQGNDLVEVQTDDATADVELTEEDLLLTPTVVFGFSFSDKVWLEFSVEKIQDVDWNVDAFDNLVLPGDRKNLLRSLVEAHRKEVGFDDFIKGKGHGLVVNLFGPPGVGKTFSAEATSEHVRRPLYVIGGGDLGTTAATLDDALERIFDVATAWKAIVLIDEADVFLEQRSLHDLERNAMVAVFLRHVEYYRGILFLTTNRVKAFDEAFLSRIHVALHFTELNQDSKEKVWSAFIQKMGTKIIDAPLASPHPIGGAASGSVITRAEISELAKRNINGRQIKNAARTAHSLAAAKGEVVTFEHLIQTLDAMDEFTREFEKRGVQVQV